MRNEFQRRNICFPKNEIISETRLNNGWEINILKPIAPAKKAKLTAGWYVPNVFVIVFTSFLEFLLNISLCKQRDSSLCSE